MWTANVVVVAQLLSRVWLFVTAPLSMGFPRWEHWSGLPFPSSGTSSPPRDCNQAGRFFTIWAPREALVMWCLANIWSNYRLLKQPKKPCSQGERDTYKMVVCVGCFLWLLAKTRTWAGAVPPAGTDGWGNAFAKWCLCLWSELTKSYTWESYRGEKSNPLYLNSSRGWVPGPPKVTKICRCPSFLQ